MTDLSRWDFQKTFTPSQIDLLIQGIDPNNGDSGEGGKSPAIERLEMAYRTILSWYVEQDEDTTGKDRNNVLDDPQVLKSTMLRGFDDHPEYGDDRMGWIYGPESDFAKQTFKRKDIHEWLVNSGLSASSIYDFGRGLAINSADDSTVSDIDPSELPTELDVANTAFRAVLNGHGDRSETFKNRLKHYLKETYPLLKNEAIERIATVANPDKSPGRKRLDKE